MKRFLPIIFACVFAWLPAAAFGQATITDFTANPDTAFLPATGGVTVTFTVTVSPAVSPTGGYNFVYDFGVVSPPVISPDPTITYTYFTEDVFLVQVDVYEQGVPTLDDSDYAIVETILLPPPYAPTGINILPDFALTVNPDDNLGQELTLDQDGVVTMDIVDTSTMAAPRATTTTYTTRWGDEADASVPGRTGTHLQHQYTDSDVYVATTTRDTGGSTTGKAKKTLAFSQRDIYGANDALGDLQADIAMAAMASNVATITTVDPHPFTAGQSVVIALRPPDPAFDGTYSVANLLTTTSFTCTTTTAHADVAATQVEGTATVYVGKEPDAAGRTIKVKTVTGKFNFTSKPKPDLVNLVWNMDLPGNFDPTTQHTIVAVGNVRDELDLNKHGKGILPTVDGYFKNVQFQYPRLSRGQTLTSGVATTKVSVLMSSDGLSAAGFAEDGISNKVNGGSGLAAERAALVPHARQIQVAVVFAGVAYYGLANVNLTVPSNDFSGSIKGRH